MRNKKSTVFNKKIINGIFLAYLIASSIFFFYYTKNQNRLMENFQNQLSDKIKKNDSILKRTELLENIIIADNNFMVGEYEEAMNAYQNLSKKKIAQEFDKKLLSFRLKRIDEIKNSKDTLLINDIKAYQFKLSAANQKIDSLFTSNDNLQTELESKITELNSKLNATKQELTEKNKQLYKKDKIQVISFRNEKGNLIHYLGEVKDGMANGGGVGIWDTGGIYKGEWNNNKRHGKGFYEWKDGHKYEGDFLHGTREGEGTYFWASGEKYVGSWKAGKRNGFGTLYDKDHNVQYEGQWLDDKIVQK